MRWLVLIMLLIAFSSAHGMLLPGETDTFTQATQTVQSGTPEDVPSSEDPGPRVSIGPLMTSLACSCLEDDSCQGGLEVFCSGFVDIPGAEELGIGTVFSAIGDPSHAMCSIGFSGFGLAPSGIDPYEPVESATPEPSALMIEAVRITTTPYTYAIRYSLDADGFESYEDVEYTLKGQGSDLRIEDLGFIEPDSAGGFPFSATFERSALLTEACISFDQAPDGLPDELCVPIREVRS